MPNRKDWQPEDTQVETAAMALRAQQIRLWNLVGDSATVGRCWQQTPRLAEVRIPADGLRDVARRPLSFP